MADARRIVVTGATGLIGRPLCAALAARGYQVVVFSRDLQKARTAVPNAADYVAWTPEEDGPWKTAVEEVWGVVHLAGAPVFGRRWSRRYKARIRDSRVIGTRGIVNAMAAAITKPVIFVSSSGAGYYGFRDDTKLDENAAPGGDFLARVCVAWEQEARRANALGVRTAILRIGVVLDRTQGALPQMALPFRLLAGGPILPGRQWLPWVHVADVIGVILMALEDDRMEGAINLTAPAPQTNRDFTWTLGKVMRRPWWLPAPALALRVVFGEFADTVTEGQRVIPARLQQLGYEWKYPTAEVALRDLLKRPA